MRFENQNYKLKGENKMNYLFEDANLKPYRCGERLLVQWECKCGRKYFIEPKEDGKMLLCFCGRKIGTRNWAEILDAGFEETKED